MKTKNKKLFPNKHGSLYLISFSLFSLENIYFIFFIIEFKKNKFLYFRNLKLN